MRRRRQTQEHTAHDRWLVSYADLITLLFAVFVVLYATSQVDQGRQMTKLGAAVQAAFRQLGSFPGTDPRSKVYREAVGAHSGGSLKNEKDGTASRHQEIDVEELEKQLQVTLAKELKDGEIEMHMSSEGLVISLREVGFFPSGSSTMLPSALPKLARIAKILNESGFGIRVEGHTDNVPIHNAAFRSNWELSTMRATEIVEILTSQYGLDPKRLSAGGFAEFRPVASNTTAEGRQMNRRVDLIVVSHITDKLQASNSHSDIGHSKESNSISTP